ncbi:MAG TPA: PAS domain-containing protein [Solirubrobacterales bacterium]|nr:PAS domain-containing protein [Solirubrobacterales bacterium]
MRRASRRPPDSPEGIQAMLDALPAMVGYWDTGLINRMANNAYIEFFGVSPAEVRGTHMRDLLGPELFAESRRFAEGALAGERQLFDRKIVTPAGETRYTQVSYIPDLSEGQVLGFFVLVTDITERSRIEGEIESSRARLADAERVARMGSWEWDVPANLLTCSDGLYAIYGIDAGDFDGSYDPSNTRYVHPDDRDRVEAEMRQAVESGAPVDFEFRIIRPDGRVRRIHSRAELIADPEGRPLRLTGTVQDVTELHAAAEALHQTASDLGRRAAALRPAVPGRDRDLGKLLSTRQVEILTLVAEGLSNAEIASRLYLTESTVKWHIRKILRALGVSNRAQAVARYLSSSA